MCTGGGAEDDEGDQDDVVSVGRFMGDVVLVKDGYSLHREPDGCVLAKIEGGPCVRIGLDDYRDEGKPNLMVAAEEAERWIAETRRLRLRPEPLKTTHRRKVVEERVYAAMTALDFPEGIASYVALDASDIVVQDVFIDTPIRFASICAIYVAAWDAGIRPSLTLIQLCKVLGAQPTTMRRLEHKYDTGYLPDSKPLTGEESYEVLVSQGGRDKGHWRPREPWR